MPVYVVAGVTPAVWGNDLPSGLLMWTGDGLTNRALWRLMPGDVAGPFVVTAFTSNVSLTVRVFGSGGGVVIPPPPSSTCSGRMP